MKWFNKQSRLIQILLLAIPGINWITEVVVRVTAVFQKFTLRNLLGCIFGVFVPIISGWLDILWIILFKHLFLAK